MREHGLQPKHGRRFVITTDSDHNGPIFPNLAGTWRLMVLTSARSPI
jgi:hypothetical protein